MSWPQPVFCENVTDGRQRRRLFDGLGSQAAEIGLRDGTDRHGNLLNVAPARLGGRDDRFFHEGDAQGEGHGDPFARPHAHGTTAPLEAAQFCGNLVVAFRKVWKREVARGAGLPPCGPRHPESSRERLAAGHQSGRRWNRPPLPRTVRPRKRPAQKTISAASNKFHGSMRRCISLHRAEHVSRPILRFVSQNRRGSQIPTRRCWLLAVLLLLGAAPSDAQPAGPPGAGAAIVRPRQR